MSAVLSIQALLLVLATGRDWLGFATVVICASLAYLIVRRLALGKGQVRYKDEKEKRRETLSQRVTGSALGIAISLAGFSMLGMYWSTG